MSITGCSHSPVRVNRRKICAHIQQPDNDHCAGLRNAILPMPNKGACHKTTTTLSGYIAFRRSAPGSRIACGDEQLILQFNTSFTPFNRIEMLIFLGTTLTRYKYTLLPSLLLGAKPVTHFQPIANVCPIARFRNKRLAWSLFELPCHCQWVLLVAPSKNGSIC